MRLIMICALALGLCASAEAQIVEVKAGGSSIYDATGAGLVFYFPNSTAEIGSGVSNGHFVFGASYLFSWRDNLVTLGDTTQSYISAGLPMSAPSRGLSVRRTRKNYELDFFVGASGQFYTAPFFIAAQADHFGSGIYFRRQLKRNLNVSTIQSVVGNEHNSLIGADWKGWNRRVTADVSGGILQNMPTFNAMGTIQPLKNLGLYANHETYVFQTQRARIDSVGFYTLVGAFNFHGTAVGGLAAGHSSSGSSVGVGTHFSIFDVGGDLFHSNYGNMESVTLGQKLGRRFHLQEFLNEYNGHRSINYGGSYSGNVVSVSVNYNTYFMPFYAGRSPFQQALSVTLSLQLPHSSRATAQTYVDPTGKVRWGIYGGSFMQGPYMGSTNSPMSNQAKHGSNGKYEMRGTCKDESGKAVEGCSILIGKETIYSDADGNFMLRESKDKAQAVKVVPNDFAAPGTWEVVSCPETAIPGQDISVVVRRD